MYCLFLADGFEEVEALTPLDYLRRAKVDVRTVGVTAKEIRGAHDIIVRADISISDLTVDDSIEGVILPGGMPGVKNLDQSEKLKEIIRFCDERSALVAAICAAPSILGRMGLLEGKQAVCYPGFEDQLMGAVVKEDKVVTDKNYITSRGAGCANEFSFALIEYLKDRETAESIASSVIYR